ncbi:MAG: CRISPR-associated ring nuclease Csm6 [Gammaproteobacteria bacterium]
MLTVSTARVPLPETANTLGTNTTMVGRGTDGDTRTVASRREPHDHARRILLVIAGLTPQVVTETLYALTQGASTRGKPPFHPTELWIATTNAGRREVEHALMERGGNQVRQLCEDYRLAVPVFGDSHVLGLTDKHGKPLEDAHDDAAFLALGDLFTAHLAEWTEDPQSAVHLSIAGGRKTMGYLAGHALSLLGRQQDRLSHVLVNSPFDRIPEFFYPPPTSCPAVARLDDGTNEVVDLSRAEVKLAYVPFLRMREVLAKALRAQAKTLPFSEIVERAQRSLDDPVVTIDTHELLMTCGGVPVKLPEENFALYYALAKRRDMGITPRAMTDEEVELYLGYYEHVLPGSDKLVDTVWSHEKVQEKSRKWLYLDKTEQRIPLGDANRYKQDQLLGNRAKEFTEMYSRCNEAIDAALGDHLATRYKIIAVPAALPGVQRAKQYLLPENLKVELIDERNRRVK